MLLTARHRNPTSKWLKEPRALLFHPSGSLEVRWVLATVISSPVISFCLSAPPLLKPDSWHSLQWQEWPPVSLAMSRWLKCKESSCQCTRHRFDPRVGKIPWRRKWQPTPKVSLNDAYSSILTGTIPHRQRSLAGCSPRGRKESDTTEQLNNNRLKKSQGGVVDTVVCNPRGPVGW